jgi:peroxiredoxin Q/BCP
MALQRTTQLILSGALALIGCGPAKRPDGGTGLLPVGAVAPDFTGQTAEGTTLRLSETRGHPTVVYFYPKDETPGCTKQACAFRDTFTKFQAAGVRVFGISRDTAESHAKFRAHHQLPFTLVADKAGSVQAAYGVPNKLPGIAARVTFLVGRDGKIAHVWPNVDPVLNVTEVLDAAQQLTEH